MDIVVDVIMAGIEMIIVIVGVCGMEVVAGVVVVDDVVVTVTTGGGGRILTET